MIIKNFICLKCEEKISVVIDEPFVGKEVICPRCKAKYKLVKRIDIIVSPHNPNILPKEVEHYDLELIS